MIELEYLDSVSQLRMPIKFGGKSRMVYWHRWYQYLTEYGVLVRVNQDMWSMKKYGDLAIGEINLN